MPVFLAAALRVLALALALAIGTASAHEGHDHGPPPPPVSKTIAPRGEAVSDAFELVAILRGGGLGLYLDRFRTGEPVTDAAVTVETPEGPQAAVAATDGSYRLPAPWLDKPGHHDIVVTVAAGGVSDVLMVGLTVPDPPAARPAEARGIVSSLGARLALPDIALPEMRLATMASGGFLLGVAAVLLVRGRRRMPAVAPPATPATILLSTGALAHGSDNHGGDDHADAPKPAALTVSGPSGPAGPADLPQRLGTGAVFVPKPTQRLLDLRTSVTESGTFPRTVSLPGRVIPNPNASGVVQSSVGGRLSPPPSGLFPRLGTRVKRGDVLAYVTPPVQRVDMSDMRQRQGELDQQIAIVQRRVERFAKLAVSGSVAQVQLDEAQDELKGLRDRRSALDRIRQEPEPLVAPVDGVIAEAGAVAGQMANAGAMVFRIVDPKDLWIEALSFDALTTGQNASARLPDGRSYDLVYQGSGLADRNQAIPVQFAIRGDASGLRVGQFVTVLAATDGQLKGLALPRASVVRTANGQDVVYEHTTAERYEARPVRTEPLDGERVLVAAGIDPGRRVVVQGAELLDQVR